MATVHLSSYFQQRFTPLNPLSDSWLARYQSELRDQTLMYVWDMGKRKDAWSRSSMGVSSASIQSETWKNVGSTWAASSTLDRGRMLGARGQCPQPQIVSWTWTWVPTRRQSWSQRQSATASLGPKAGNELVEAEVEAKETRSLSTNVKSRSWKPSKSVVATLVQSRAIGQGRPAQTRGSRWQQERSRWGEERDWPS